MSRPPAIDAETAATLLRSCHSRRLDREGIPMVVVLADERGAATAAGADESRRSEGAGYADLLEVYAEVLTPGTAFRPDDEGALITVLQVLAYAHFPSPGDAVAPALAGEAE
jgi:hypothetical protein